MPTDVNDILSTVAPSLNSFGLLTEDDWDRAAALHQDATRYRALARNSEAVVAGKIAETAEKLAGDAKTTPDKVVVAASNLPDPDHVSKIAEQIERSLDRQARTLVVARAGEAVPMVNAAFQSIAAETADVAEQLGPVDSPQAAIDSGRTDLWRRGGELMAEYAELRAFISALADLKLVAAPKDRDRGPHWLWVRDSDPDDWVATGASKFKSFARDMRRGPWRPASIEEADAVRNEWAKAQVSA